MFTCKLIKCKKVNQTFLNLQTQEPGISLGRIFSSDFHESSSSSSVLSYSWKSEIEDLQINSQTGEVELTALTEAGRFVIPGV